MTDKLRALVLLNMVEGIGSVRIKKLLEIFHEPQRIFRVSAHELTRTGILTPMMAKRVLEAPHRFSVDAEIDEAENRNIRILTMFDEDYPVLLKEIYDPPIVLYVRGEFLPADINAVGIVGSRGASFYGMSCADEFSGRLARSGITIVSGLARGIDTASHRAALNAGGRTIAVLGSGLNQIYPPENRGLFDEISDHGAVISEFSLNTFPMPYNFPIRNRIISGLSRGVLVVEASQKSGALITARFALEQGREVFAIPGKLTSETSSGANDLIKQGARMVTEPEEILKDLACLFSLSYEEFEEALIAQPEDSRDHDAPMLSVMKTLSDEPKDIDVISAECLLGASDVASILTQLELKGIAKRLPGRTFVKVASCARR